MEKSQKSFNVLEAVRRIFSSHDFLFLGRQLTYHIFATSDMPQAAGNEDRIEAVLSKLVGHMVEDAPRGSRIDVEVKESARRGDKAVEIAFAGMSEKTVHMDKAAFMEELFGGGKHPVSVCKKAITKHGGRLFADLPEPKKPLYRVLLPMAGSLPPAVVGNQEIFKYEIAIKNISTIRKSFGIKKSQSLVRQIEDFVRSLVRHPIDIVMAVYDRGIITVIYETPKGAAQSVAGRISARLGSEKFLIGKKEISLDFRYILSALPQPPIRYK